MSEATITATPSISNSLTALKGVLGGIVGAENIRDDDASRALFSEDIWDKSAFTTMLIVSPANTTELAAVVKAAADAGVSIAPRGAGMSYTGGYYPADAHTISLDTSRMNRVLKVSPDDMTITVEAGASWKTIDDTLAPMGLRLPFWGPMSGIWSTIGGGLSNLNAMFGCGHYGTSSESVIAITMVLADGSVLKTGARGPDGDTPFYRHYGPDLAGLFMGDAGTLGIKAEITFRLMQRPAFEDSASFSFKTGPIMLQALGEMARAGIAAETCGFDPGLTKVRMKRMGMTADVKALGAVMLKEKNIFKSLLAAFKIAKAGRSFIEEEEYPLHITAEGRCAEAVAADLAKAREIAKKYDGVEIANTIAKVIRAMPFPPPNSILGPEGESWIPVHGQVSLSNAPKMFAEIKAYFDSMQADYDRLGIHNGFLFSTLHNNAIVMEPVFFWPKGYRPIHESMVEPAHLAKLKKLGDAEEATAFVTAGREMVKRICEKYGCAHFQIGRSYKYRESRNPAFLRVLDAVKATVDPKGQFNPGCLGFPPAKGDAQ
ncbi:FAD-binding protein [Novosphingobium sp. FSY-8]|uniref:FAD-binding protein n=1 Tax=Novosphingobium ovatum TaxID=1908523 RepID=A0ABW9XBV5_9SPHN|nr:FAD-binding oxidoreductase [Novosphingobium ovatum]NBC36014.1 FAD-binding protein [Novosphingobium ovatum]